MLYEDCVRYLKEINQKFTGKDIPDEIKRKLIDIESRVYDFEMAAFEVILKSINTEREQINFINLEKDKNKSNVLVNDFCTKKLEEHQNNITNYGNQVLSLYMRDKIIDVYERRKKSCLERIAYCKNSLKQNPTDNISNKSLLYDEQYNKELDNALDVLYGRTNDLIHSNILVSEVGHKL